MNRNTIAAVRTLNGLTEKQLPDTATIEQVVSAGRAGVIASALREGKINAAQSAGFERMFDSDPRGALQLLTAPVSEGGLMAGVHNSVTAAQSDVADDAYPADWLPEVRGSGSGGRIAGDDPGRVAAQVPAAPAAPPATTTGADDDGYPAEWLTAAERNPARQRVTIEKD